MSTLKVNKIEATGTTDGGIEIDSDGHVQLDGVQLPTSGQLSNRNLIINGACRVNQRQTTPSISSTEAYIGPVDHFEVRTNGGEWQGEATQETVSVNGEFTSCYRIKTTTAETTVSGNDQIVVESLIEGQDIQHLFHSTSSAKSLTLSFWVRSSQPGTYALKLYRADGSSGRQLNKTYTISSEEADTWKYVSETWVGDTAGAAIPDANYEGMRVSWQIAAGPDFTSGTQPTTWTDYSDAIWAAGHSENSFMTTVDATWDVTGVQLEVGDKATPFEHRSYGDELARCQRYYLRVIAHTNNARMATAGNGSVSSCFPTLFLPTTMRAQPSIDISSVGHFTTEGITGGGQQVCTAIGFNAASSTAVTLGVSASGGSTSATGGQLLANTTDGFLELRAEL